MLFHLVSPEGRFASLSLLCYILPAMSGISKTYLLANLPDATLGVIRAKEAEVASIKSWRSTAKLVASAILALLGVAGTLFSIFSTLIPVVYGASIIAIGIGGGLVKKFSTDRNEADQVLRDFKECQTDLARGTPFRRFLETSQKKELSWEKLQQAHKQFKEATKSIQ